MAQTTQTIVIDADAMSKAVAQAGRDMRARIERSLSAFWASQKQRPIVDAAGFAHHRRMLYGLLKSTEPIHRGAWQALDVKASPLHATHEANGHRVEVAVPQNIGQWQLMVQPDLPWAEDHFQERVSGNPMNPAPSEQWWPYAVKGNSLHKNAGKFDHTYLERYWPKAAGSDSDGMGIRFPYGDLADVVETLDQNPLTRQAVLTVWFPEDQWAARAGKRVPCSLSYHFLMNNGRLDVHYTIRSCDFYRHYVNDIYMTGRLLQWVCDGLDNIQPGKLVMNVSNLHLFVGDMEKVTL